MMINLIIKFKSYKPTNRDFFILLYSWFVLNWELFKIDHIKINFYSGILALIFG